MADQLHFGVYRGEVAGTDDPEQRGRLTLRVPQILGTGFSNWAEPSDPPSHVPNVGQWVWVQFVGGDVTKPVYTSYGGKLLKDRLDLLAEQSSFDGTPTRPVITNNNPGTSFTWSQFVIRKNGVDYVVPAGGSSNKYLYWDFATKAMTGSDTLPTWLTDNDVLMFYNRNGVAVNVQTTQVVDGGLFVSGSIVSDALAAGSITAEKLLAGAITTDKLTVGLQHSVVQKLYDMMGDTSVWKAPPEYTTVPPITLISGSTESVTGNTMIRLDGTTVNTNGWYIRHTKIPFDPEVLYRVTARVRTKTNSTVADTNKVFIGVTGYAGDGTYVNVSGNNAYHSHYWVAVAGTTQLAADGWKTYTGYIKGTAATGDSVAHPNIKNPQKLRPAVRFISPTIIMNFNNGNGVYDWDQLTIEVVETGQINSITLLDSATGSTAITMDEDNGIRFFTPTAQATPNASLSKEGRLFTNTTSDVSLTSSLNPIQVGLTTAANMVLDNNEIQARNNGAAAGLALQMSGGNTSIGGPLSAPKKMQAGSHTFTAVAANTVYSQAITFAKPFNSTPILTATANTSAPQTCSVSVGSVSTTGFTLYFHRSTAVDTNVQWQAIVP